MKFEKTDEDLSITLDDQEEVVLVQKVPQQYDDLEDARQRQLDDIHQIRETIYNNQIQQING